MKLADSFRKLLQPTPPQLQKRLGWDFHVLHLTIIGILGGLYYYGLSCINIEPTTKMSLQRELEAKQKNHLEQMDSTLNQVVASLKVINERLVTFEKELQEKKEEPKK